MKHLHHLMTHKVCTVRPSEIKCKLWHINIKASSVMGKPFFEFLRKRKIEERTWNDWKLQHNCASILSNQIQTENYNSFVPRLPSWFVFKLWAKRAMTVIHKSPMQPLEVTKSGLKELPRRRWVRSLQCREASCRCAENLYLGNSRALALELAVPWKSSYSHLRSHKAFRIG